jgi:hypothetical protein
MQRVDTAKVPVVADGTKLEPNQPPLRPALHKPIDDGGDDWYELG